MEEEKKHFEKFNNSMSYWLGNIFKFFWTIFKFLIKVCGVLLITFPLIIIGMAFISPETAVKTIEAIAAILRAFIDIFK